MRPHIESNAGMEGRGDPVSQVLLLLLRQESP